MLQAPLLFLILWHVLHLVDVFDGNIWFYNSARFPFFLYDFTFMINSVLHLQNRRWRSNFEFIRVPSLLLFVRPFAWVTWNNESSRLMLWCFFRLCCTCPWVVRSFKVITVLDTLFPDRHKTSDISEIIYVRFKFRRATLLNLSREIAWL